MKKACLIKIKQAFFILKNTMNFINKLKQFFKNRYLKNVRIEEIKPFQRNLEIKTPTIWITDSNIEDCLKAVQELGIKHIHLQTKTFDFLEDKRLKDINGLTIQYEMADANILYKFASLTHLGLPGGIKTNLNFSNFSSLIYLGGRLPKKYINLDKLTKLKYTYLFNYNEKDFTTFKKCKSLTKVEINNSNCETLIGLSGLAHLKNISLDRCPKLNSTEDLGHNPRLEILRLCNCKSLNDISSLRNLSNLRTLQFQNILELKSFDIFEKLNNLENLLVSPHNVGVENEDYYPLIRKLKSMGKLDQIKSWKKLASYLDNSFLISNNQQSKQTEWQKLSNQKPLLDWQDKLEDGLEQYTKDNCESAQNILSKLIENLEGFKEMDLDSKLELFKTAVLEFNALNESLGHSFIETGEREDLCTILDNIADTVGIDLQSFEDGIAMEWREW